MSLLVLLALGQVASVCGAGKVCNATRYTSAIPASGSEIASMCMRNPAGTPWSFDTSTASTWSLKYDGAANICPRPGFTATAFTYNSGSLAFAVNGSASASTNVNGTTGLSTGATGVGTAFGSFPACSGSNAGRILYDSTNGYLRVCDGSSTWRIVTSSTAGYSAPSQGAWFAYSGTSAEGAAPEATSFYGLWTPKPANGSVTTDVITCSWAVAGTGGATGVVAEIYNVTDSTQVCSCTLGACTTAARAPVSCQCTGTTNAVSTKTYAVRLTTGTDCTANPQQISCNVTLLP